MWIQQETLYIWLPDNLNTNGITNVAGFDLDWTLIKPERTKFPRNPQDNVIMKGRIPTLKKYLMAGYTIVVFSNQKLTPKENLEYKLARMNDVIDKFQKEGISLILMMATQDDKYRKPEVGMWDVLRIIAKNIRVAFFSGDAAGRENDHSDSDLMFAKNIGIQFEIPEMVFR